MLTKISLYNISTKIINVLFRMFFKVNITGIENIPRDSRLIVCSNHMGVLDPVLIGSMIPRKVHYMAKKELFKNKIFGFLISKLGAFPVDRDTSGLSAIKTAIKLLKQDKVFAIFPEGTRSKGENDNNAKPGLAMIAIKAKSPIIPIHIDTQYEIFNSIKITIGSAIVFGEYFDKRISTKEYEELSNRVLKEIYNLKLI